MDNSRSCSLRRGTLHQILELLRKLRFIVDAIHGINQTLRSAARHHGSRSSTSGSQIFSGGRRQPITLSWQVDRPAR